MSAVPPPGSSGPTQPHSPRSTSDKNPVTHAALGVLHSTGDSPPHQGGLDDATFAALTGAAKRPFTQQLDKAGAAVAQSPTVSEAFKKAFQTVHESLKKLWEEVAAPTLAILANAAAIPLKATFLAVNYLVVLPLSLLADAALILAEKATGQKFTAAHELPSLGLASVILSTIEFHPQALKGDFPALKELFKGDLKQAEKLFSTARHEALKAMGLVSPEHARGT